MLTAICDDELIYCEIIKQAIFSYIERKHEDIEIKTYISGSELLKSNVAEFDMCILDIEMPEIQGFELATAIMEQNPDCKIVFISSHHELVQEGYKVSAFRFLYKPIQQNELDDVLDAVLRSRYKMQGLLLKSSKNSTFLRFCDIIFAESLGDGLAIYTEKESFVDKQSLNMISQQMDDRFFRCHQTYIVNLQLIRTIDYEKKKIIMKNGVELPISFRKKSELRQSYYDMIRRRAGWI